MQLVFYSVRRMTSRTDTQTNTVAYVSLQVPLLTVRGWKFKRLKQVSGKTVTSAFIQMLIYIYPSLSDLFLYTNFIGF